MHFLVFWLSIEIRSVIEVLLSRMIDKDEKETIKKERETLHRNGDFWKKTSE